MTSGFGGLFEGFFCLGLRGGVKFSLAIEEYPIFTAAICYWKCTLAFNIMSSTTAGSTQEEERSLSSSLFREHEEL